MKRLIKPILLLLLLFIIAICGATAMLYYGYAIKKQTVKSGTIYIPSTLNSINEQAALLYDNGFIKDTTIYLAYAKRLGKDIVYHGKFDIKDNSSLKQLFADLGRWGQEPVMVTFNNIRNVERLASVVSKFIEADSASIASFITSDKNSAKYGFKKETFLSMFIPNSYEFYWSCSAEEFADRMKREYDTYWNSDRETKRKALNMSREEVSILASIVIEETKAKSEMARVAGVYINRLKRGMMLQADPTVKFALGDPTIKRVLYKHLEVNSPYNTYKHTGLPPGVIYVPPIEAIDRVLNYEKHSYLYFCASPQLDGTHRFARTLSEHNRNSAAYSAALNRLGIK